MQQKISEYTFLTLISTAFFLVWGTLFSGHINAWYWANFFTTDISFFNYFLKERDLLQYIASFLMLFFKWNWIGAFILTSSVICIYLLTRRLLRALTFSSNANFISIIPCITLFALQIHRAFPFRKTLFVVCFLLFLLTFIWSFKNSRLHISISIILSLLSLWMFDSIEKVYFYTVCLITEILLSKKSLKYYLSTAFAILDISFIVFFFQEKDSLPHFKEPFVLQLIIFPIFIITLLFLSKTNFKNIKIILCLPISVLICFLCFLFETRNYSFEEQQQYEKLFCYNKAVISNDYNEIINLAENERQKTTELFPFVVYAHAQQGNLTEFLFKYPINSKTFFLPYALPNSPVQTTTLAIYFYRALGFQNEAIHQAFSLSANHTNGDEMLSAYLLAELQTEKGDSLLAEKYLHLMSKTIVNNSFVKKQRSKLQNKNFLIPTDSLLYVNSPQLNNLMSAFICNPRNQFARDMLLCTLLQQREYNLFCGFCTRYIDTNEELPTLYQEALLMAQNMEISTMEGKCFRINEQTQKRWQEFVKIFNNTQLDNRSRQIALRPFRYTWWYYCLMSPEKIN